VSAGAGGPAAAAAVRFRSAASLR